MAPIDVNKKGFFSASIVLRFVAWDYNYFHYNAEMILALSERSHDD
jgi:hypothetical protein